MQDLFLLVNPCSGKAVMKARLLDTVRVFSDAGYRVTVYPTKCRGDATRVVAELPDSFDTVVVCGGDGTLNEVITGLMHNPNRFDLGYIPAGTLNEWSGGLGIKRDPVAAARDILSQNRIPLDIGRFGDRYFEYTASFGAFTRASYSAPQNVKNLLGQVAYFFEGIKSLGAIRPIELRFLLDGQPVEGSFLFGAVSNSMSVGGVVKFDETAVRLNDGLFEVLLIRTPANVFELNDIIDGLLKKDLCRKNIVFTHVHEVLVQGSKEIDWTLDGEYAAGQEEIHIQNLHGALDFLVPEHHQKRLQGNGL